MCSSLEEEVAAILAPWFVIPDRGEQVLNKVFYRIRTSRG